MNWKRLSVWAAAVTLVGIVCAGTASAAVVDKDAPYEGEYFIAYNDHIGAPSDQLSEPLPVSLLSEGETDAAQPGNSVIGVRTNENGETIYRLEPRGLSDRVKPPAVSPRRYAAPRRSAPPQPGDEREFIIVYPMTDYSTPAPFVLKYSGKYCNIWLEKADARGITDELVTELGMEYDVKIHDRMLNAYGSAYDRDEDGKIAFLLYDIQDSYDSAGSYVGGFFMPSDLVGDRFNCMDVLHIDTYPSMFNNEGEIDLSEVKSTMVHELQHLIEMSYCVEKGHGELPIWVHDELPVWVNEGLSMAAEHMIYGTLDSRIRYYNEEAYWNTPLADWTDDMDDSLSNYAFSYLFFQYLRTQTKDFTGGGEELFRYIVRSDKRTALCVEKAMKQFYPYISMGDIFRNFYIALTLNEPTGLYGFAGEPGFAALQPKLYPYGGDLVYLGNGAAVVRKMESKGYTPDEGAISNLRYAAFTPGEEGVDSPKANVSNGQVYQFKNVTLSCSERYATMYYTLDGTEPDETSLIYTGKPIQLLSDTTLKAVTITPDGRKSAVVEYSYTLAPGDVELYRILAGDIEGYGVGAYGVIQAPDGGLIQVGEFSSNTAGSEDFYEVSGDNSFHDKVYLAKYTQDGTIQWIRPFGGEWAMGAFDIEPLEDGFAIAGYTNRFNATPHVGDFEGLPIEMNEVYDENWTASCAYIAKFDWEGNKQWVSGYPLYHSPKLDGEYADSYGATKKFTSLAVDSDGNLIAVGMTNYMYGGGEYHGTQQENIGSPIIAKVDTLGNFLWRQELSLPTGCSDFFEVALLDDGTIIASGYATQNALGQGYLKDCPSQAESPSGNILVPILAAFDQDGTPLWVRAYEEYSRQYYGYFSYLLPLEGGFATSGRDCILCFSADASGCELRWRAACPGLSAPKLALAEDGIMTVGAITNGNIPHYGLTPITGTSETLALKLDADDGKPLWKQNYATNYYSHVSRQGTAHDLIPLGNRKYAVTGERGSIRDEYRNKLINDHAFLFTFYDESTPYYKVSGNVGLPGVSIGGKLSDSQGNYTVKVMEGESVTLTPELAGYTFSPAAVTVGPVTENSPNHNFMATEIKYTLSGTVLDKDGTPLAGVSVGGATTDADGRYSLQVRPGSNVLLTPALAGKTFEPAGRTLTTVSGDADGLDFRVPKPRYTISGTVTRDGKGQGGVEVISGVLTQPDGTYSITVEEGTALTLAPRFNSSYDFTPATREIPAVTADVPDQNFTMKNPFAEPQVLKVEPSAVAFTAQKEGYAPVDAVTVTVTYVSGTGAVTGLTAQLPPDSDFELSSLSANTLNSAGDSATLTVKPKDGLKAGAHSDTVTIQNGETTLTVSVAFQVEAAEKPTPDKPDEPDPDKPGPSKPDDPTPPSPPSGPTYTPSGPSSDDSDDDDDDPPKPAKKPEPAVTYIDHLPYMTGYDDGTFRTEADLTRGQCAAVLSRLDEDYAPEKKYPENFPDVPDNSWYANYIGYLTSKNVIRGYPDGTFQPDEPITRAEFVTLLCNVLKPEVSAENHYPDAETHWAVNYIGRLTEVGILNGYPDGTFRPDNPITRAEAVKSVNGAYDRPALAAQLQSVSNPFPDLNSSYWAYYEILEASVKHQLQK